MENLPAICEEPGHLRRGDLSGDLCAGAQPAHCHLGALAEGGPLGAWGCGRGLGLGMMMKRNPNLGTMCFYSNVDGVLQLGFTLPSHHYTVQVLNTHRDI